jgi:hypothetical protein
MINILADSLFRGSCRNNHGTSFHRRCHRPASR